jgi:hypothetical protein
MGILIFIRQKVTCKFAAKDGRWVEALEDAHTFQSTWHALDFCFKKQIIRAEIVMRMGEERYDVVLDVYTR